ncbi:MAG: glycosyltransferase family 1 protein [Candidatus Abyssobacteria bacterium SURF_5]|uniref:Glycosyltransferase family 1 protein n=1 Tax=Abyssobacteria bacterium (strain SURF_5) TaxID=2093360 RepID=A0A3A4NVL4_ABYX5|nr:MAG: glycosyltransferase family 1 protein [Candidatus Abyssubacteria bacterium SURF_5]
MKILHLFSNIKLTGPAEPAVNLCASLRSLGYDVQFACGRPHVSGGSSVEKAALERGLEPITAFRLSKHMSIRHNLRDMRKLPSFLQDARIDMVHAHLDNDHLIGGRAARKANRNLLVVRSSYSGEGMKSSLRGRYLLHECTDGLVVASETAKANVLAGFRFPEERIWVVPGAVDTDRFDRANVSADFRSRLGLSEQDFVLGVVARIQPHRRFDVILKAMKSVSLSDPQVKLLIVGRGTRMKQVAVDPVREMGLENQVKFAGYHVGQDYVNTIACFDSLIFLMPGTDGTCRAVRESLSMGIPAIVARRGMLPEIVDHAVNGLVIEDSPDSLAAAVRYLARDRNTVASMSEQARKKAREKLGLDLQARKIADIYEKMRNLGRRMGRE